METKICKKCGRELPISEFHKNKSKKDGYSSWCKECNKEHEKKRRADNPKYFKQWYEENREASLERMKEYNKQYRKTFKSYCFNIRSHNIKNDRKYCRIGGELPSNYPTVEDYVELLQLPDFYDGKQYHWSEMGLDRIDNSKPHTLDNVVPCTTEHNVQRGTIPFDVFKAKFNKNQPINQ